MGLDLEDYKTIIVDAYGMYCNRALSEVHIEVECVYQSDEGNEEYFKVPVCPNAYSHSPMPLSLRYQWGITATYCSSSLLEM